MGFAHGPSFWDGARQALWLLPAGMGGYLEAQSLFQVSRDTKAYWLSRSPSVLAPATQFMNPVMSCLFKKIGEGLARENRRIRTGSWWWEWLV